MMRDPDTSPASRLAAWRMVLALVVLAVLCQGCKLVQDEFWYY